jgi:hypothetical protein
MQASYSRFDIPEIGNVDEGIVEGGEDTSNTEDELAYGGAHILANATQCASSHSKCNLPSRAEGPREMFSWGARATFLGGILEVWRGLVSRLAVGNDESLE